MAEIVPVVSEALEATIRNLLPSQRGFGEDLQASNVITPIIDLTSAAEGSQVPAFLQQAISFGSITSFDLRSSAATLANSPGFWRFYGVSTLTGSGSLAVSSKFEITNGLSTKLLWDHENGAVGGTGSAVNFDFVVFLQAGESVTGNSNSTIAPLTGTYRQIADVNGTLVNPSGFTPQ